MCTSVSECQGSKTSVSISVYIEMFVCIIIWIMSSIIILCSVLVAQRQTYENKPSVKQDEIKINLSKKIVDLSIFFTHLGSVYISSVISFSSKMFHFLMI